MSARATSPPARERSERVRGSRRGPERSEGARRETPSAVRSSILSAAVDLFAEQGYDGTSVSQVVSRAGVAKGGFYHHFASKEALLYEVYGDLIDRQLATMNAIVRRGLEPADALRAIVEDLVISTAESARPALVFWREISRLGDERTAQYRRQRRRYHDAVRKLIRDGQASGAFSRVASADTVTYTIFGVVNELPIWFKPGGRTRPVQFAGELADFVLAGLAPEKGDSRS